MAEFPAHVLLALGYDHLRMLAVWHVVPMQQDSGTPNLYQWAQLADVPVARVKALWPVLRDLGCCLPGGALPSAVRGLLLKRVKEMIEGD